MCVCSSFLLSTSGRPVLCMEVWQHRDLRVLQFCFCFSCATLLLGRVTAVRLHLASCSFLTCSQCPPPKIRVWTHSPWFAESHDPFMWWYKKAKFDKGRFSGIFDIPLLSLLFSKRHYTSVDRQVTAKKKKTPTQRRSPDTISILCFENTCSVGNAWYTWQNLYKWTSEKLIICYRQIT